ncbi:MAG: histidine phosphatase family protein, partial [Bacteroidota bacterium]
NILVVAHGNSLRALVMALEGLSPEQILQFELPTAMPRVYRLDENLRVLSAEMI